MNRQLFDDKAIAIIRTIVPTIAGQIIGWLAVMGIVDATGEISALLITALTTLGTLLYYVLARYLETRFSSSFGWLLGYAKQPSYTKGK